MSEAQPVRIHGAGGGKGGSKATARAPNEAPNTLRSRATAYIMDILGEGQIEGFVDGMKSVFFDGTPLMAADGSYNFQGVSLVLMGGYPDQQSPAAYVAEQNAREVAVGRLVSKKNGPIIKTIYADPLTRIRVTVRVPALLLQNKETGDISGAAVQWQIEIKAQDTSWFVVSDNTISGKCTSPYERSITFPVWGTAPYQIRVSRLSEDTDDRNEVQDSLYWASYTEILDWRIGYVDTAYVGLALDSETFGGTVPQRTYKVRGIKMLMPENYDPIARTYAASGPGTTGGVWNGSMAKHAWTNNPAWIFYDLLTNTRYGLGSQIKPSMVDKWALYEIAQYCDQLVPDGKGGMEPRFTFNGVINTRDDAYSVLQSVAATFRGMVYWGGGTITATQDRPMSPVKLVTNDNVIGGNFSYEGTALRARHTVANVLFTDEEDNFKPDIEPVQGKGLGRRGIVPLEIVGMGLSKRSQARRIGRWALDVEQNETQTCSYRGGLDQVDVRPGDIVLVADRWWQGARFGGRLVSAEANTITVDAPVLIDGSGAWLKVTLPDGTLEERVVYNGPGTYTVLTVASPFSQTPQADAVWLLVLGSVAPRPHRVISVVEVDKHLFEISSLFHDETKYDRVDFGINRAPPSFSMFPTGPIQPVTGITYSEYQVITNGAVRAMMTVSWEHPKDARVRAYTVEVKRPTDPGYTPAGDAYGNSIDIGDITDGVGAVRIRAVDALGRYSVWTELTGMVLVGLKWVPDNVTSFGADVIDGVLRLTWNAVRQAKSVNYKIKYTPSLNAPAWQSASTLIESVDALQFDAPPRDGAYLVKAVSLAGVECPAAALIITNAVSLALFNVIATVVEDPDWTGLKTGTTLNGGRLTLAPGQISGTYEFSGPDIGEPSIVRVTAAVDAYGVIASDYMANWATLADVERLASGLGEDWSAGLEYRTTIDDPVEEGWSAWIPFSMSDVEARQIQFRLTIASLDGGNTKVEVGELNATIDVPDRVEAANNITVPAPGMWITFNENFRLTPAIAVTGQDLATGDYWIITGQNRTSFHIQFVNAAGSGVSRTADWIAKGYGRERSFTSRKHFRGTLEGVGTLTTPTPIQGFGAIAHLIGGADGVDNRCNVQWDATSGPPVLGPEGGGGVLPRNWLVATNSTPWEVTDYGDQFGIEYCDVRFVGDTSVTANSQVYFAPIGTETRDVVAGQAWETSLYIGIAAGDLTNITGIQIRTALPGQATSTQTLALDSVMRRVEGGFTITTATSIASYGVNVLHAAGAAIDITLRLGRPFISPLRLITAKVAIGMTASLTGQGGLVATARPKYAGKATLAGVGTVRSWAGDKMGAGKLAGVGTVTAGMPRVYFRPDATLLGAGGVVASPKSIVKALPAAIGGIASLAVLPRAIVKPAPAAIGGAGTLSAYAAETPTRWDFLQAAMPGTPPLTVARSTKGWHFDAPVGGGRPALVEVPIDAPSFDYGPSVVYNSVDNPWGDGIVISTGALPTGWSLVQNGGLFTATCKPGRLSDGTPYVDIRVAGTPGTTSAWTLAFQNNTAPAEVGDAFAYDIGACVISGGTTGSSAVSVGVQEMTGSTVIAGIFTGSTVGVAASPARYMGNRTASSGSIDNMRAAMRVTGHTAGVALDFTVRICFPVMNRGTTSIAAATPAATLARRAGETLTQNPWGDGVVIGTPGTLPTRWFGVAGGLSAAMSGTGLNPDGQPYIEYTISGTSNGIFQMIQAGTYNSGSPLIPLLSTEYFSGEIGLEIISMSGTGAVRAAMFSYNASGSPLLANAALGTNYTGPVGYQRYRLSRSLDHANAAGAGIGAYISGLTNGAAFNCVLRLSAPLLWRGNAVYITDSVPLHGAMARTKQPLYGMRGLMVRRKASVLNKNPRAEGSSAGTPGTDPTGWSVTATGGLSKQTYAAASLDGIPLHKVRLFGTASGGDGTTIGAVYAWGDATTGTYGRHSATTGEKVAVSAFLGLLDALPAVKVRFAIDEYSSGGTLLGSTAGSWQTLSRVRSTGAEDGLGQRRLWEVFTVASSGAVTFVARLEVANASATTALNFSLLIGAPQVTKTYYVYAVALPGVGSPGTSSVGPDIIYTATSNIPVDTTAGVTLAAEFELMRGTVFYYGNSEVLSYGTAGDLDGYRLNLSNNGTSNPFNATKTVGGVVQNATAVSVQEAFAVSPILRMVGSWSPSSFRRYYSTLGEVSYAPNAGLATPGATYTVVGAYSTTTTEARQINGWVREIGIYPAGYSVAGIIDKLPG